MVLEILQGNIYTDKSNNFLVLGNSNIYNYNNRTTTHILERTCIG